jgi:hypothetical protein
VFEFRVTKYDPAFRDRHRAYTRDEWTSVSDIGQSFAGVLLTEPEYQRIEDAYATAAIAFMREAGVHSLTITGLENNWHVPLPFNEGSSLGLNDAGTVVRRVLREEFWCRLEAIAGFVHLGRDYYMYVGVSQQCPAAELFARHLGLFVEEFCSPYNEQRRA